MKAKVSYFTIFFAFTILGSVVNVSMAATCDVTQLAPCLDAMTSSAAPSPTCCARLKSQRTCLCQYLKNPFLKQYVNGPNSRKVGTACGVLFPTC
ncbi:hypothetical protein IFM89_010578 [Coptis chinensis]|uniref:Bifunctional inhibitor/plant lipid transfer protein/seed storage helical domain-containing protein n=1 Tax=Coptis chinensis TaxID=261450 RepID=A0A835INU3_9MAGN|nr:hypothetical protein IFM89_010578 [Coptis chinensis]